MKKIISLGILAAFMGGAYAAQNNFYVGLGGGADFLKSETKMSENGIDKKKNSTKGKIDVFAGWNCDTCSKIDFGLELRGGMHFGKTKSEVVYAKSGAVLSGDGFAAMKASEYGTALTDATVTAAIKKDALAAAYGAALAVPVANLTWTSANEGQRAGIVAAYAAQFKTKSGATPNITLADGTAIPPAGVDDADSTFKIASLTYDADQVCTSKVKRKPFVALMAMAGLDIAPGKKIYITGGMKFWKVKIDNTTLFMGETIETSSNKTELTPVVGAGFQMDFKEKWFGRIEYNHEFKENINNAPDKAKLLNLKKSKVSSHCARLAIGYKFK